MVVILVFVFALKVKRIGKRKNGRDKDEKREGKNIHKTTIKINGLTKSIM